MNFDVETALESLFLETIGGAPLDRLAEICAVSGRITPALAQIVTRLVRLQYNFTASTEHRDGIVAELNALLQVFEDSVALALSPAPADGIASLTAAFSTVPELKTFLDPAVVERVRLSAGLFVMTLSNRGRVGEKDLSQFLQDAEQRVAPPFDAIHRALFKILRDMAVFERTRHAADCGMLKRQAAVAEARFEALTALAEQPVALINRDGAVVFTNNAFQKRGDLLVPKPAGLEGPCADEPAEVDLSTDSALSEGKGEGATCAPKIQDLSDGGRLAVWPMPPKAALSSEKADALLYTDSLTGLPNRMALFQFIDDRLSSSFSPDGVLALLLLDLDHFKKVNDTYGHSVGDELLKQVAGRMRDCLDDNDLIARLGGDEFAICIVSEKEGSAQIFSKAQRVSTALGEPFTIRNYVIRTGSSIGVTIYPHDPGNRDQLMQNADIALYKAKQAGRGIIALFDRNMRQAQVKKQKLEDDLGRALEEKQFSVYYQPQVSLETGEVIGVEALVRWNHPELGLVEPGAFIETAEGTGQIVPMTNWLISQACQDVRYWSEQGYFCGGVSVNISPVHFAHSGLISTIRDVLAATRIDPRSLELEITETAILDQRFDPGTILEELKDLGVRIAIDDFGMGYSSLSRLKTMPIDRLKVDKSFVRDMALDDKNHAIAATIINLGHSLDVAVIAEGVESAELFRLIKQIGCTEVQGYFISQPLPKNEVSAFLEAHDPSKMLAHLLDQSQAA